jgi:hypothetical protein
MITNNRFTLLFLLVALIALLGACQKNNTVQTPKDRIQGKWKLYKYAYDDNNNGNIENREIYLQQTQITTTLYFAANGTGEEKTHINDKTSDIVLPYNWKIVGNDSVWIGYRANDTLIYYILNVSSAELTLTRHTKLGLSWYNYLKQ